MGGGGLVILKHKSWHVWRHDNVERVRKDEQAARLEEEMKQRRAEEAEQEHRIKVLRTRADEQHRRKPRVDQAQDDDEGEFEQKRSRPELMTEDFAGEEGKSSF